MAMLLLWFQAAFHIDAESLEQDNSPLQRAIFQALTGISSQMKDPLTRVRKTRYSQFVLLLFFVRAFKLFDDLL